jgi:uncharacterized protein YyaL (SSP411 family)
VRFAGWAAVALEAWLDGPREVAVVGPAGDAARAELAAVALRSRAPGLVMVVGEPGDDHPLLAGRPLVGGAAAAYVCRRFVCDAPTTDPARLAEQLGSALGDHR